MTHGFQRSRSSSVPLVAVLLSAFAAGACRQQVSGEEDGPTQGVRVAEPAHVVAAPVERRAMVRYLETTTRVESEREITIHPEVVGIVTHVAVEEGDHVREGDILCQIDAEDEELSLRDAEVALQEAKDGERQPVLDRAEAQARLNSARLSWEQARRDHERDQRLFENTEVASPVSRQALEASRLTMETAGADHEAAQIALQKAELAVSSAATAVSRAEVVLAQAERALAQRTIRAQFDGQIATRSVRLGQSIGPADAIFVLTDVDDVRAVFYRAQEELGLFHGAGSDGPANGASSESLTFEATTEALPGAVFTGRVVRVSPTIDRDSGQFRVTGAFDQPAAGGPPLLPGMLVRLRIATDRHADALVVPKRAVRREGDFTYVLKIQDDDTVMRVQVAEGYEDDDAIEVIPAVADALTEGDRVVSVGSRDLEDGDPVRVPGDKDADEDDLDDEPAADTDETPGDADETEGSTLPDDENAE